MVRTATQASQVPLARQAHKVLRVTLALRGQLVLRALQDLMVRMEILAFPARPVHRASKDRRETLVLRASQVSLRGSLASTEKTAPMVTPGQLVLRAPKVLRVRLVRLARKVRPVCLLGSRVWMVRMGLMVTLARLAPRGRKVRKETQAQLAHKDLLESPLGSPGSMVKMVTTDHLARLAHRGLRVILGLPVQRAQLDHLGHQGPTVMKTTPGRLVSHRDPSPILLSFTREARQLTLELTALFQL